MGYLNEEDFLSSFKAINRFQTSLSQSISDSDTTIYLTDIGSLSASIKGEISIGTEHIFYDGFLGNALLNCERGYDDSSATSHSAGDLVQQRINSDVINKVIDAIKDIPKIDLSNSVTAILSSDSFTPARGNASIQLYGESLTSDNVINISSTNVNDGEILVLECMNDLTFRNVGNLVVDPIGLTSDVLVPQYGVMGLYWHGSANKWRPIFSSLGLLNYSVTASNKLETPTDGNFNDGAIQGWTVGVTTYSDAFDDVNEFLLRLIPARPTSLSAFSLSMTGGANSRSSINILLASGVTDNAGDGIPASGTQVYRITTASVSSAAISGFGSGNSGTLSAMKNGVVSGSRACTTGDDSGTYTSLVIEADINYGTPTGFWQSLTAKEVATLSAGINKFQLRHSQDGNTNEVYFVYDSSSPTAGFTAITISENLPGTLRYSSGIGHYDSGASLNVNATITSLASMCYLASNNVEIVSTSGFGTQVNIDPGVAGLPSIFSSGMGAQSITSSFTIGGTIHTFGQIQARGRNASTDGSYSAAASICNIMSGTPTSALIAPVQEMNIYLSTLLGTTPSGADTVAKRILLASGDTPSTDVSGLTASDWVASASVSAYEAKIVGGVLKHSIINYSSGYLPVGPNYSSHNSKQYSTFYFRKSGVSQFKISVSGTYTECWVKMFNSGATSSINNWFDASLLYAGAGVPGSNGSNGCTVGTVMNGSSGLFQITFGTESSTNSINSIILVRFSLTAGQIITSLGFKE